MSLFINCRDFEDNKEGFPSQIHDYEINYFAFPSLSKHQIGHTFFRGGLLTFILHIN